MAAHSGRPTEVPLSLLQRQLFVRFLGRGEWRDEIPCLQSIDSSMFWLAMKMLSPWRGRVLRDLRAGCYTGSPLPEAQDRVCVTSRPGSLYGLDRTKRNTASDHRRDFPSLIRP